MDTSTAKAVGDILHNLPEDRAARELVLHRLTEVCAAGEATAALRSAAARAREAVGTAPGARTSGDASGDTLVADVLSTASALWDAGLATGDGAVVDPAGRTRLIDAITSRTFLTLVPSWVAALREIAAARPGTGACTVATAMQLWRWTMAHVQRSSDAERGRLAAAELAEAFCGLIAARCQILAVGDHVEPAPATGRHAVAGGQAFLTDLCHVQAARTANRVAALCAELVFGYQPHPAWDVEGCSACYQADDLEALEGFFPGFASSARAQGDVIEADGSHAAKAGPCARFDGLDPFTRLRARLDGCLTGSRLAKDRAAAALPRVLDTVASTH